MRHAHPTLKVQDREITCLYTVLGPMVRHYALNYGFHTFANMLKGEIYNEHGRKWKE